MSTPTKTPGLPQGIITPSCDITPTRETARDDAAYDDFALSQNDCSELPRDDAAPTSAPAVSVEPAYDGAEPSPSSPFTYDGDGDRAEPAAGGFDSFDPFPGIPAPRCPRASPARRRPPSLTRRRRPREPPPAWSAPGFPGTDRKS